jgi:NAD(P)-dependent dehydrogenase (short-subunit alcohol dehydrogenase family)
VSLTALQTNVKGVLIAIQAFMPTAGEPGASIYAINAGGLALPAKATAGLSGYLTSKVAQAKLMEYLAAENPNLFVCSVQPGVIDTGMLDKSELPRDKLPMDTGKCPNV